MLDVKAPPAVDVWSDEGFSRPVISGSGNRLLFQLAQTGLLESHYFGTAYSRGLLATDGAGGSVEELVDVGEHAGVHSLEMTADGHSIVFDSQWMGRRCSAFENVKLHTPGGSVNGENVRQRIGLLQGFEAFDNIRSLFPTCDLSDMRGD